MTPSDPALLLALETVLKASLILGAAGLLTRALAKAPAALRHLVWMLAVTGVLVLPVLAVALPTWNIGLVTLATPAADRDNAPEDFVVAPLDAPLAAPTGPPAPSALAPPPAAAGATVDTMPDPSRAAAGRPAASRLRSLSWGGLLAMVWAIGFLLVVGRVALSLMAVRLVAGTRAPDGARWVAVARELAATLAIARPVAFLQGAARAMPMACGLLRAAVLLPSSADAWPVDRLRMVLLHELAHVKRHDCLTQTVTRLACALYWFNPLVWIAARHIRSERERACDDLVLAAGTEGPDYAEELLEIARDMRATRPALLAGATLAMARRSQLEGRLMAILDPNTPRTTISRRRQALVGVAVASAVILLATLQSWTYAASPGRDGAAAGAPWLSRVDAFDDAQVEPAAAAVPTPPARPALEAPRPAPAPQPTPAPRARPARQSYDEIGRDIERALEPLLASIENQAAGFELDMLAMKDLSSVIEGVVNGALEGVNASVIQESVDAAVGASATIAGSVAEATAASIAAAVQQAVDSAARTPAARRAADPRLVAALTEALQDSSPAVRENAVQALATLRDPAAFDAIAKALKDPSADIREQAAFGLAQLRDPRGVEPLRQALGDGNPSVRERAAFALGQLRSADGVDALVAALKDDNTSVREQAAFALGQIRGSRAVEALLVAAKDPEESVREQVVFALGQLRDPRAIGVLTQALTDASVSVREQAAFALGQLSR